MRTYNTAKEICKKHDIKGFRKLKLTRTVYVAGKQCSNLKPVDALRLLNDLKEAGYGVADFNTCRELAEKGLLDTISIS